MKIVSRLKTLVTLVVAIVSILFLITNIGRPKDDDPISPKASSYSYLGDVYINLRFIYDQDLLSRFSGNHDAVKDFILEISHSASLTYNNRPLNYFAKYHFVVQSIELIHPSIKINEKHNGNNYRIITKNYYDNREYRDIVFTSVILLTGHNFLFERNKTDTQGLAHVGGACTQSNDRYIIVEARSYRAAFVMAHELGHNLNMSHDENIGCGGNYIMSVTTGPGKVKFSKCSADTLFRFLEFNIKSRNIIGQCLRYKDYSQAIAIFPSNNQNNDNNHKYKSVSVTKQCQYSLGKMFVEQDHKNVMSNICTRIGCANGIIKIYIHPAIENTTCDQDKYCLAGKCRSTSDDESKI